MLRHLVPTPDEAELKNLEEVNHQRMIDLENKKVGAAFINCNPRHMYLASTFSPGLCHHVYLLSILAENRARTFQKSMEWHSKVTSACGWL